MKHLSAWFKYRHVVLGASANQRTGVHSLCVCFQGTPRQARVPGESCDTLYCSRTGSISGATMGKHVAEPGRGHPWAAPPLAWEPQVLIPVACPEKTWLQNPDYIRKGVIRRALKTLDPFGPSEVKSFDWSLR